MNGQWGRELHVRPLIRGEMKLRELAMQRKGCHLNEEQKHLQTYIEERFTWKQKEALNILCMEIFRFAYYDRPTLRDLVNQVRYGDGLTLKYLGNIIEKAQVGRILQELENIKYKNQKLAKSV